MHIDYTRSISKVDWDEETGLIRTAHWDVLGVARDGTRARAYGTYEFENADADAAGFTKLDDVSEQQVMAWIEEEYWRGMEQHVAKKIDDNRKPAASGTPWKRPEPAPEPEPEVETTE